MYRCDVKQEPTGRQLGERDLVEGSLVEPIEVPNPSARQVDPRRERADPVVTRCLGGQYDHRGARLDDLPEEPVFIEPVGRQRAGVGVADHADVSMAAGVTSECTLLVQGSNEEK